MACCVVSNVVGLGEIDPTALTAVPDAAAGKQANKPLQVAYIFLKNHNIMTAQGNQS